MTWLLVALGAAVGAPIRYLVDHAVRSRQDGPFPWGTLLVNVVGSLALGLLIGASAEGAGSVELTALLGTGFCGALTTYSTFSYETLRLVEDRHLVHAALNVAVSIGAGLAAAALGVTVAGFVWG
jgi:CrcB protein